MVHGRSGYERDLIAMARTEYSSSAGGILNYDRRRLDERTDPEGGRPEDSGREKSEFKSIKGVFFQGFSQEHSDLDKEGN